MKSTAATIYRKNLVRAAKAQGVNQRELARRSGVHWVTVNRVVRGHIVPSIPVAERLAAAVGLPLSKIFAGRA